MTYKNSIIVLILTTLFLGSGIVYYNQKEPTKVEDDRSGAELRVVSLIPSGTEIVCALGGIKNLVARSKYCNYPPEVLDVPVAGNVIDSDMERIKSYSPDALIVSQSMASNEYIQILKKGNVKVVEVSSKGYDTVINDIKSIGDIINKKQQASELASKIERNIKTLSKPVTEKSPKVLILIRQNNYLTGVGCDGYPSVMLERIGMKNAFDFTGYKSISMERIFAADPDFIVDLNSMGNSILTVEEYRQESKEFWSKWDQLRAVKNGDVWVPDNNEKDVLQRPGPRIDTAVKLLSDHVYSGNYLRNE